MVPKYLLQCPVCGNRDVVSKNEISEGCLKCGSVWKSDGRLLVDPRTNMNEGDILVKGWFVDVN